MGSKWVRTCLYIRGVCLGYNPLTNHVLTSSHPSRLPNISSMCWNTLEHFGCLLGCPAGSDCNKLVSELVSDFFHLGTYIQPTFPKKSGYMRPKKGMFSIQSYCGHGMLRPSIPRDIGIVLDSKGLYKGVIDHPSSRTSRTVRFFQ